MREKRKRKKEENIYHQENIIIKQIKNVEKCCDESISKKAT